MKTIAAISTPRGSGGIAVIRISGSDALKVAGRFFAADNKAELKPRTAALGTAALEGFSDRCIATYFKAPNTYTGEDIVEISCHGGDFVAQSVLKECLKSGAALAAPGEFTKRAFLNGKLSLSGAEGVVDLINSESAAEASAASFLADGVLSREAKEIQNEITDLLAQIEAAIDYPDDVDFLDKDKIRTVLDKLINRLNEITSSYAYGKILKNGLNVAIIGRPNVGKSSLMNALLKHDRSIVTPTAGTTRDTVSETLIIKDLKINIVDTAGIRESTDAIEKLGVERSKKAIESADLVLFVFDGAKPLDAEEQRILFSLRGKRAMLIANKCDIAGRMKKHAATTPPPAHVLNISALKNINIDKLAEAIYASAKTFGGQGAITITNERHLLVLSVAAAQLTSARDSLTANTADLIAADITEAFKKLGEITGTTASEEIINRIFEKFCLGK